MTVAILEAVAVGALDLQSASTLDPGEVLSRLGSSDRGMSDADVLERRLRYGDNAVGRRHASATSLLWRQLRSPLLGLLLAAAVVSFFVGERTDALVVGAILAISVGLGFVNEYRSERAAQALHQQIQHRQLVVRNGHAAEVDPVTLVPGDLIRLRLGDIVPADVRLLRVDNLECDESVLTGESAATAKTCDAAATPSAPVPQNCASMGTIVAGGTADAVVVSIGGSTEFGRIADSLGTHNPQTAFQVGLNSFSRMLAGVAGALTVAIFIINFVLGRPLVDALLFSLAIAIGITPQLLPAIVSVSLSTGSRRLAARKVLVKRLICIEDLGNIEMLITDKTGTLTEGAIALRSALGPDGKPSDRTLVLARLCSDVVLDGDVLVSGNPLDVAIRASTPPPADGWRTLATLPFDHDRRLLSVVVTGVGDGATMITKGAPESVLTRCTGITPSTGRTLDEIVGRGSRVVAVATKPIPWLSGGPTVTITAGDESALSFVGFVEFSDPPKVSAGAAVARLARLGIAVRIATGDHPAVAVHVCEQLGIAVQGVLTGAELDALDEDSLGEAIGSVTVFARVSPEQKARIVDAARAAGIHTAFLGDGVNDAVALHRADVGISVDSATEVAKDAADIVLLEKNLDVLADGVSEGRAIFANTIKYVLMATSSNFGNMFSAAVASAFMRFLPMLPSQILLNNLLYDVSQMAIPTDRVDEEQLNRPAHWDIRMIRRFMAVFGPISSVFDILTFVFMLRVLHADRAEFRAGWFVESLATQTLVIFVIRTRRTPFFRSRASVTLTCSTLICVAVGVAVPFSPFASSIGFRGLPARYLVTLPVMIVLYLGIVEGAKVLFFAHLARHPTTAPSRGAADAPRHVQPLAAQRSHRQRLVYRRAARLSHPAARRPKHAGRHS